MRTKHHLAHISHLGGAGNN